MVNSDRAWLLAEATYSAWYEDGTLTDGETLRLLSEQYAQVDDGIVGLTVFKDTLRNYLSQIVERMGGKVELPTFGKLSMTSPARTTTYDKAALDDLVTLLQDTAPDIAAQVAACRKEGAKAGSLRIERIR